MSILQETIQDARRPLADGWVWRSVIEEDSGTTEEGGAADGTQTVFRFQKEGPARAPEASFQPSNEGKPSWAADPSPAGGNVDGPVSPANGAPVTGVITGMESRIGRQEGDGSPFEVREIRKEIVTGKTVQSPRVLATAETNPFQPDVVSSISGGGDRLVQLGVGSYSRQYTGRGAPSETSPQASAAGSDLISPAAVAAAKATGAGTDGIPLTVEAAMRATAGHRHEQPAIAESGHPAIPDARSAPALFQEENGPVAREPARPARAIGHAQAMPARPSENFRAPAGKVQAKSPAPEPSLVIGRIDVVVVASEPKPQAGASVSGGERGFLSRNYLKRL